MSPPGFANTPMTRRFGKYRVNTRATTQFGMKRHETGHRLRNKKDISQITGLLIIQRLLGRRMAPRRLRLYSSSLSTVRVLVRPRFAKVPHNRARRMFELDTGPVCTCEVSVMGRKSRLLSLQTIEIQSFPMWRVFAICCSWSVLNCVLTWSTISVYPSS